MDSSQHDRDLNEWEKPDSYHLSWKKNASSLKPALAGVAFLSVVSGLFVMFDDKRPVGAFFEQFVAAFLYITIFFGGLWFAMWIGAVAYEKSGFKTIGWIIGIMSMLLVLLCSTFFIEKIPGVGWRFELLRDSGDDT